MQQAVFGISKKVNYYNGIMMMVDEGMHEEIMNRIDCLLPQGSIILDMGCGQGALSQRLIDRGYRVVSVDKDRSNYKAANTDFVEVDFDDQLALARFIECNKKRFDCVLGIEVIEHVHDHYAYAKALAKMCRKDGYVLISTPNITNHLSRVIFMLTGRYLQFLPSDLSYGHIHPCGSWQLALVLEQAGLELKALLPVGNLPLIYMATFKMFLLSLLALPLKLFMAGPSSGWCLLSISQKK